MIPVARREPLQRHRSAYPHDQGHSHGPARVDHEDPLPSPAQHPDAAAQPEPPARSASSRLALLGRRIRRRPLLAAAALGAAAVLVGSGMSYAAVAHYSGAVHRSDVFAHVTDRPLDDGGTNILVVGSDDRGALTEDQRLALHLGIADFGRNTDTILLVHIGDDGTVDVISVPRDSALRIPAHTDPDGTPVEAATNKVNSAYGAGGATLLIQTLEDATDVRIDHYVEVDFGGFMAIVDALGGVDVCTPEPISDENSGLELPAGRTHVDGAQGLAYVRARYFDPTADVGRMGRQQAFLGAMFARATSLGTLANPGRLDATANAALNSVTTDTGLDDNAVRDLAVQLQTTDPGKVRFATLPLADDVELPDGGSAVRWDPSGTTAIFAALKTGASVFAESPAPTTPSAAPAASAASAAAVPPGDITVEVLNGSSTEGLARTAADSFSALGYSVAQVGNGDPVDVATVAYDPEQSRALDTLRAALPGADFLPVPGHGATFTITVPAGFAGPQEATAAAPSDAESPQAAARSAADDVCR